MKKFKTKIMLCMSSAIFMPSPSWAQDSAESAAGSDIIVTAQRRSERVQDVPVSVAVLSQQELQNSGVNSVQDIQFLSPSVQVNRSGSESFQIRGVGTASTGYYLEQSVGVVVDGVPIALPNDIGLGALADVAQIEVLRGPQGTLFGKNTSAGLINVTTRRPSLVSSSADGRVTYGERNDRSVSLNANVPLNSDLAVLVSGAYHHQDGFIHNLLDGERLGNYTDKAVRAKIYWQPAPAFDALLSADFQQRTGSDPAYLSVFRTFGVTDGYGSGALGVVPGPENTDVAQDMPGFFRAKRRGVSLQMTYALGNAKITSITAFRKVSTAYQMDSDGGPIEVASTLNWSRAHQFSQELRIEAPKSDLIDAQAGLFYYRRSGTQFYNSRGTYARSIPPGYEFLSYSGGLQRDHGENESYAAFADATWHVTDKLNLQVGGRYTHDMVSSEYSVDPISTYYPIGAPIPVNGYRDKFKSSDFSYRGIIQYFFTRDIMVYGSYARGYKGPAFNATNASLTRIKPEIVKSLEGGIKGTFLDKKIMTSLSLFHSKFTDFQTQALDPVTRIVSLTNAGGQRTQGAEFEFTARPLDGVSISANVAYTDAKFTDYLNSCYIGQTAATGCINGTFQAAGTPLPLVSKWSYSLSGGYAIPISDNYKLDFNGNLFWKGSVLSSVDPGSRIRGYTIANLNVGFGPDNASWKIGIYARNIFNKYYVARSRRVFDGYLDTPSMDARRTIGGYLNFSI